MTDQAQELREKFLRMKAGKTAKAVAVISGKGGVGKSNFSLNFAIALSKKGKNVLLFDMDIGMGNIDILMGMSAEKTVVDMLQQKLPAREIIEQGPSGISYVAGGTGLTDMFELDHDRLAFFLDEIEKISYQYDYMIFDMGAGLTKDSLQFILAAQEIIVLSTPEPTSITDAYAAMKYIFLQKEDASFHLLVNRAHSQKEGEQTSVRLLDAIDRFLKKEIKALGSLPDDRALQKAVIRQSPFLISQPKAPISQAVMELAEKFSNETGAPPKSQHGFIAKLRVFFER